MENIIRKRKADKEGGVRRRLNTPPEEEVHENQAKRARGQDVMTVDKAVQAINNLWKGQCKPHDPALGLVLGGVYQGTKTLRRALACNTDELVSDMVKSGFINQFFFLVDLDRYYSDPKMDHDIGFIRFEASWCLTNIAGTHAHAIIEPPENLEILGRAMKSAHPMLREQAIWCVGNIAASGGRHERKFRSVIINHPTVWQGIQNNIEKPGDIKILKTSIWTFGACVCSMSPPGLDKIKTSLILVLNAYRVALVDPNLGKEDQSTILYEVLWSIKQAMMHDQEVVEFVGNSTDFIPQTLAVLKDARLSGNDKIVVRALSCIDLLLSDGSNAIHEAFEKDFFVESKALLNMSSSSRILKEVCSCLGCLVDTCTPARLVKFTKYSLHGVIKVANANNWGTKKEACLALFKFLQLSDHSCHIYFFSSMGGIKVLCDTVESTKSFDTEVCLEAMKAIEALLSVDRDHDEALSVRERLHEHGGVRYIERLLDHPMAELNAKADSIIDEYFGSDENEEGDKICEATAERDGSYVFGLQKGLLATTSHASTPLENRSPLLG